MLHIICLDLWNVVVIHDVVDVVNGHQIYLISNLMLGYDFNVLILNWWNIVVQLLLRNSLHHII